MWHSVVGELLGCGTVLLVSCWDVARCVCELLGCGTVLLVSCWDVAQCCW